MDVKLSLDEGNVLMETLEARERALLEKIAHARRETAKTALRKKEQVLDSIIHKLEVEREEEESFCDLWW